MTDALTDQSRNEANNSGATVEATEAKPVDRDTGYAPPRWEFDAEVTRVFDDMLERSIPQYDVMRGTVTDIAIRYVQPGTDIIDLGCSRGEALAPLISRFGAQCHFVGIERSAPMIKSARDRFAGYCSSGVVDIIDHDLRQGLPRHVRASVIQSVLTLMFVPIERRQQLVRDIYDRLVPGGAFIVVEKVLGNTAEIDALLVDRYYALKADQGYSGEEIERKRLSLEGVLVPVTARWNEDMFAAAGFRQIDCFWRWMNFAGWIALKEASAR